MIPEQPTDCTVCKRWAELLWELRYFGLQSPLVSSDSVKAEFLLEIKEIWFVFLLQEFGHSARLFVVVWAHQATN